MVDRPAPSQKSGFYSLANEFKFVLSPLTQISVF